MARYSEAPTAKADVYVSAPRAVVWALVSCEEPQAFGWVVGDPALPSARWGFELAAEDGRTRVRQWAILGPGPSGLTPAIEAMPGKEERIVARRLAEHETNMRRCLEGIKALAESRSR